MMSPALRRLLHACSPVVLVPAWWFPWSTVQGLLAVLALSAVLLDVIRLKAPGFSLRLARLVPVWRERERTRPSGAMWLALAFALAARASMDAALGGMLAAAWADPAASLVGRRFGRGPGKSWPGTTAAFVVTGLVVLGVGYPVPVAVVAAVAGAAFERWVVAPDDNCWLAPGVTMVLVAFA